MKTPRNYSGDNKLDVALACLKCWTICLKIMFFEWRVPPRSLWRWGFNLATEADCAVARERMKRPEMQATLAKLRAQ